MLYKICLTMIFACSLGGCAAPVSGLKTQIWSENLPKINDPARLVEQENALSRWLVRYQKMLKNVHNE